MEKSWDVIIIGIGDLGHRVATLLHQNGVSVLGISRTKKNTLYPSLAMDIFSNQLCEMRLKSHTLLYSIAADNGLAESYQSAYVDGLLQIKDSIQCQNIINISSTRVFESQVTHWTTERTPKVPESVPATILINATKILSDNDCNLMLGGIYGPGRTRLIRLAKQGYWCQPGHVTNRIHIEDAAGLCHHLIQLKLQNQTIPSELLGVDGQAAEMHSVLDWLRQQTTSELVMENEITYSNPGKKCRSDFLSDIGYKFIYPDFQQGYLTLLQTEE